MEERYLTATTKNVRGSARKIRLTTDLLKGMKAMEAIQMLDLLNRKASRPVMNTIKSAVSNAVSKGLNADALKISSIRVNEATTYKRSRAASHARMTRINKRGCHIYVELSV